MVIDSLLIGLRRELYLKFVYKISVKLQHLCWITRPIFSELMHAPITPINNTKDKSVKNDVQLRYF